MTVTCVMPTVPERVEFRGQAVLSAQTQTWGRVPVALGTGPNPWTARNAALARVETPWTAFLDDDDWWLPNHVATLLAGQEESGADVVYSDCLEVHEGEPTPRDVGPFDPDRLRAGNYIPVTYLIRTDIAQAITFPPREEGRPSDWLFLLRLLDEGVTFHHVPETTWVWRRWEGNSWSWRS